MKNDPCPCQSGRKYRQCCWLRRFAKPAAPTAPPTPPPLASTPPPDLYEACQCGSGKVYRRCCYPRTFPDPTKPNFGLEPHLDQAAMRRALRRLAALPPQPNATISTVDVGRTRLDCAPIPPLGDALPGTLGPPTARQVEGKYDLIREGNPDGVTEVLVSYTYPEEFGVAEARMVFDADEHFILADGRVVSVLELKCGMQLRMDKGGTGAVTADPEFRTEHPVPPLPSDGGLWHSRVVGQVKHTTYEIIHFRWAGQEVRVTPGHVVWSEDRQWWIRAQELTPGELVRVAGNFVAQVEGPGRVKTAPVEVYGIEVEYFHNYFVGRGPDAMLVHNGPECVGKPARAESGKLASGSKAAMSTDPNFATGYDAIFNPKAPVAKPAASEVPVAKPTAPEWATLEPNLTRTSKESVGNLERSLKNNDIPQPSTDHIGHHVIPGTVYFASPMLKQIGFRIDHFPNGAWVEKSFHPGRHPAYTAAMKKILSEIPTPTDLAGRAVAAQRTGAVLEAAKTVLAGKKPPLRFEDAQAINPQLKFAEFKAQWEAAIRAEIK